MALIYEIIDTQGKIVPADWKRLINFSLRNLDSISLIKNFLSSDNYIYSHPDNIKSKIIEKILDDSNLQDTLNRRKQFWINTRIDRFGENCFIAKKDSTEVVDKSEFIPNHQNENSINSKNTSEIIEESKPENNNSNDFLTNEVNPIVTENIPSLSNMDNNIDNYQPEETNKELTQEDIDNILAFEENPNNKENDETEKEIEPNFNNTEFKFDNIIYNGLDDLMNNIDSDVSREIIVKTLTGKINKNYKKKYKEVLSKLFIFKDNEWICVLTN